MINTKRTFRRFPRIAISSVTVMAIGLGLLFTGLVVVSSSLEAWTPGADPVVEVIGEIGEDGSLTGTLTPQAERGFGRPTVISTLLASVAVLGFFTFAFSELANHASEEAHRKTLVRSATKAVLGMFLLFCAVLVELHLIGLLFGETTVNTINLYVALGVMSLFLWPSFTLMLSSLFRGIEVLWKQVTNPWLRA